MSVNVNNNFNSAEDKVQFALGTMKAYSINFKHTDGGSCCPGIIALTPGEAIIKVLKGCPMSHCGVLKVNECE